jgi:hypothetical protein
MLFRVLSSVDSGSRRMVLKKYRDRNKRDFHASQVGFLCSPIWPFDVHNDLAIATFRKRMPADTAFARNRVWFAAEKLRNRIRIGSCRAIHPTDGYHPQSAYDPPDPTPNAQGHLGEPNPFVLRNETVIRPTAINRLARSGPLLCSCRLAWPT